MGHKLLRGSPKHGSRPRARVWDKPNDARGHGLARKLAMGACAKPNYGLASNLGLGPRSPVKRLASDRKSRL
ncbi:hypothetical protein ACFX2C_040335 [Malus domestica]